MTSDELERRLREALQIEATKAPLRQTHWVQPTAQFTWAVSGTTRQAENLVASDPQMPTAEPCLLVVEDDNEMRQLLTQLLTSDGYYVQSVSTSAAAIRAVAAREPELVLLDVMLGSEDGRELLPELRRMSDVPVVFLTARGHEIDKIAGLKMGADDYIVKPFSPGELSARVGSLLRRSHRGPRPSGIADFGGLRIDFVAREVEVDGCVVDLTPKEYDMLAFLAASPRRAFSRGQLLDHVWSSSSDWQGEATVTEHIRRLRSKIEIDPDRPQWITTVRSVGYRFEPIDRRKGDRPVEGQTDRDRID